MRTCRFEPNVFHRYRLADSSVRKKETKMTVTNEARI
jgi:hypothetical protein